MKKLILKIPFLFIVSLAFYQCSDDSEQFVASQAGAPILLEADIPNALVLDPQLSSNTIINFSWQEADYNVATQKTYNLEISGTQDFLNPIMVSSTTQRSIALTVSQLNNALGDAGLAPFQDGTAYSRIRSTIGTQNSLAQISNVVSFTVFPYTTELPRLYVVGAYQGNSGYGTSNAEAPTLASSEFGNETNYEGFVYFGGSDLDFQLHRAGFVGEYVDGNPIYGSDGGVASEGASGSFSAPAEGFYRVTVNLDTGAVSLTQTNWGIIGPGSPAGNWDADVDMTYDINNQVWVFENATTSAGEFKFRANDDWGLNLGIDGNSDGSLDYGGDNFNNTIGASRFVLDLSSPRAYSSSISNP